jgi:hypothetical protein
MDNVPCGSHWNSKNLREDVFFLAAAFRMAVVLCRDRSASPVRVIMINFLNE